jgi:hypothetical protein
MSKFIDYSGEKFGKLTVVSLAEPYVSPSGNRITKWSCSCDCGKTEVIVSGVKLKNGHTRSCGCYQKQRAKEAKTTHGCSYTRFYRVWASMRERCDNPKHKDYSLYGGRGITYQESWNYFENFKEDMTEGYSDKLELDRICPNLNYTVDNCRWATESMQSYNRRLSSLNTSGVCGVYYCNTANKWVAQISKEGIQMKLGQFIDFDSAVLARKEAELTFYGFNKENTND